eukprot:3217634-Pyramimonas_sp.AAC.1
MHPQEEEVPPVQRDTRRAVPPPPLGKSCIDPDFLSPDCLCGRQRAGKSDWPPERCFVSSAFLQQSQSRLRPPCLRLRYHSHLQYVGAFVKGPKILGQSIQ